MKLELSVCVIKLHDVKVCGGMQVYLHAFLISALDGCFVGLTLRRFVPRVKAPR